MVREQGRVLIAPAPAGLQPARERRVPVRALRLRQRAVRNLARERVLERVLLVAGHGGGGRAANEVAFFQGAKIRLGPPQQVAKCARREISADNGSRLQGALLGLAEK